MSESLWQMPQACTLIRTDPAPGSGIGRSTISKGPFGRETCATRIIAMFSPFRSPSFDMNCRTETHTFLSQTPKQCVDFDCRQPKSTTLSRHQDLTDLAVRLQ